jgi:hypothetical protein
MAKKLTARQMLARYEALTEAALHLEMDWTDVPSERAEGLVIAEQLKREALKWLNKSKEAKLI